MSDKAQPTPGPWWAASVDDVPVATYHGIVAILSSDPPIYVVTGEPGDKNGPLCSSRSWSANARLIAAAPDLLEALRLHDVYIDTPTDRGGSFGRKGQARAAFDDAKRAAIAKATGA